ncbi:MAG: type II secretion system protein [Kiritimatiellae bacterium]|nr:type II secretion system protein [Kiritimatiellia bacterium]
MSNYMHGGKMSARAFTLVEVVVATTLMILTLAAFISAFVMAKKSAVISENRMEAVHNARNVMEQLLTRTYTNVGASPKISVSNVTYSVVEVVYPEYKIKNILVTSKWVNPAGSITSFFVLTGSMSSELHQ